MVWGKASSTNPLAVALHTDLTIPKKDVIPAGTGLRGGTFDVSILEVSEDTTRSNQLTETRNWVEPITVTINWLRHSFQKRETALNLKILWLKQRLDDAAEKAKIELSDCCSDRN